MLNTALEDFQTAAKGLKNNKGRTILSLVGIMIGIGCVITVSSLGNSLKVATKKMFEDMNTRLISARPNRGIDSLKLDDEYRRTVMREIPMIEAVYLENISRAHAIVRNLSLPDQEIFAVDYGWFQASGMKFAVGSDFSKSSYAEGFGEVIIGERVADVLFPEGNPIGKTMWLYFIRYHENGERTILPKSFKVAAVLTNTQTLSGQTRNYIVVPRSTAIRCGFEGNFTMLDILAAKQEEVAAVKRAVSELSDRLSGTPNTLSMWTLEEIIQQNMTASNMISLVLGAIAALSLLVGGIGIMNIMIVTVTERKQEIGIRKALGASNRNILSQFLSETILITFIGAFFGCVLGLGASPILIHVMQTMIQKQNSDAHLIFVPDIFGMLIALAVSTVIGIFFGLYPALQAAKLDPVIALEEE